MTDADFLKLFRAAAPDDPMALEGLAAAYLAEVREALRLGVALAGTTDPYAGTAQMLVSQLAEAGLPPLTMTFGDGPRMAPWALAQAGRSFSELEATVGAGLRRSLGDRRPAPMPPSDEYLEEPVRARRICDEAYLALREILSGETKFDFELNADCFLGTPESERDGEIMRFAQTGVFRNYCSEAGAEGEGWA